MYIKNSEIRHLRKHHPQLLNQAAGYLIKTEDLSGYEFPESDLSDVMFISLVDALEDFKPITCKKGHQLDIETWGYVCPVCKKTNLGTSLNCRKG